MNQLQPIYTERTQCQDCYKCIRECPVKAIKVEAGYASIVPDLCILCGDCVEVCPHGAKKVRYDRGKVERLIASGERVVVSLAPSWVSEFAEIEPAQMPAALKRLGFEAVSETALGAEEVTAHLNALLAEGGGGPVLSSACPVVVEYVRRYRPDLAGSIAPLLSPALAHARLLKGAFGEQARVVFIGPCIAKKWEADTHPDLLAAALTFADLRQWFEDCGISPEELAASPDDRFVPETASDGALYPIEGGMLAGLNQDNCAAMSFSGLHAVRQALDGIGVAGGKLFLELLACEGGCVNGPKAIRGNAVRKRTSVLARAAEPAATRAPRIAIDETYQPSPAPRPVVSEVQVREALRSVGKTTPEDELNCGGCGYDDCREFARALASGRAERQMCASYMRKLAQKKTNVLMQKMPSGIVIVDDRLRIVECNPRFAEFFGLPDSAEEDLAGTELQTLVPFHNLFRDVLHAGGEILDKQIRYRSRVFNSSVFEIEPGALIGGIFRDATKPAVEKEQIIQRAREVIRKNLLTVQQIAYLIGENAAESEMTLNAIVDSFSAENGGERKS